MKNKWTRRRFLEAGLGTSIVAGSAAMAGIAGPREVRAAQEARHGSLGLNSHQLELLRATVDEIIPASDGMPAAGEMGAVEYLDRLARQAPSVRKELGKSLTALGDLSRENFGRDFASLSRADKVDALKRLERQPPSELFTTLRDFTYEAYYTRPKVWKLIGYEFYPTNQSGPRMEPFDEAVLARVRKMPRLYREAR